MGGMVTGADSSVSCLRPSHCFCDKANCLVSFLRIKITIINSTEAVGVEHALQAARSFIFIIVLDA